MRQLTGRQRRAALALAVLAVAFCTLDVVAGRFDGARGGVQGVLGALYRGTDPVLGPARRWVQGLPGAGRDADTIASLRAQVAGLQRAQTDTAAERATRAALSRLQLQASRGGYAVLPARVTAIGPAGGFDWTVVLDAGSADGIRIGQTVISGPAVVGRVVRVSASSATVLLLADARSGIGARDRATGELGTVTGSGPRHLTWAPLDPAARIRTGATLVTGPAGSTSYVPGLMVGTVDSVSTTPGGGTVARVEPAVKASRLDVLGVIRPNRTGPPRPALTPGPGNRPGGYWNPASSSVLGSTR
ncbi:MAG: rod shape-determining protein MreC [bacterium]